MTEIEKVLEKGNLLKLPHWKIYNSLNLRQAGISASSENGYGLMPTTSQTWESTREFLKQNLDLLPPGDYTIHFKSAPDDKDKIVHTFKITNDLPAIGNGNQLQQQNSAMPWQMMVATIGQTFEAKLAHQNALQDLKFEQYKFEQARMNYEKKLKEKDKGSGIKISEIFDGIDKTIVRLDMIKNRMNNEPTTQVAVTGANAANVPVTEVKKDAPVVDDDKLTLSEHLVEVNKSVAMELIEFFGSADEMVINLYCLSKFLKEPDSADMYEHIIKPKLAKYREEIDNG